MEPMAGVDLAKAARQADEAVVRVATQRLAEYIKAMWLFG